MYGIEGSFSKIDLITTISHATQIYWSCACYHTKMLLVLRSQVWTNEGHTTCMKVGNRLVCVTLYEVTEQEGEMKVYRTFLVETSTSTHWKQYISNTTVYWIPPVHYIVRNTESQVLKDAWKHLRVPNQHERPTINLPRSKLSLVVRACHAPFRARRQFVPHIFLSRWTLSAAKFRVQISSDPWIWTRISIFKGRRICPSLDLNLR